MLNCHWLFVNCLVASRTSYNSIARFSKNSNVISYFHFIPCSIKYYGHVKFFVKTELQLCLKAVLFHHSSILMSCFWSNMISLENKGREGWFPLHMSVSGRPIRQILICHSCHSEMLSRKTTDEHSLKWLHSAAGKHARRLIIFKNVFFKEHRISRLLKFAKSRALFINWYTCLQILR